MDILKKLQDEFNIKVTQVENTVKLLDEGNTVPFIARYRKELTGALDDQIIRQLSERLTALRNLEEKREQLRQQLTDGTLDPFCRKIVSQDGTVVNDGTHHFTVDELLRMDWLCENIDGYIPEYEEVLPYAQPMMKALGLHKERIPAEKDDLV